MYLTGFDILGPQTGSAACCEPLLRALPQWFGIEAAVLDYLAAIDRLPTFRARQGEVTVGFLTVKQHFPAAAEVYVMGVHPDHHRRGIGEALLRAAEGWLQVQGVVFLQVKTLSAADPDPHYARTRAFYLAQGFTPLEEFPLLWGADNPCLQLIKRLSPTP